MLGNRNVPEDTTDKVLEIPEEVCNIIVNYAMDNNNKTLIGLSSFFKTPTPLQERILYLVREAAPLDEIEGCIRAAYSLCQARQMKNLLIILKKAILIAISSLDFTLTKKINDVVVVLDLGLAENLLKLQKELFPRDAESICDDLLVLIEPETVLEAKERELKNEQALSQVFAAFKKNTSTLSEEISLFKDFVNSSRPEIKSEQDSVQLPYQKAMLRHHLNLLHLHYCAFKKAKECVSLTGGRNGELAEKFRIEIMGNILQKSLATSPRLCQIFMHGPSFLINNISGVKREIDANRENFFGEGSNKILGKNSYYDDWDKSPYDFSDEKYKSVLVCIMDTPDIFFSLSHCHEKGMQGLLKYIADEPSLNQNFNRCK